MGIKLHSPTNGKKLSIQTLMFEKANNMYHFCEINNLYKEVYVHIKALAFCTPYLVSNIMYTQ